MTGPTRKGQASRQHIIDVAAAVLARRGYAGTRMGDIIEESGLTKGAIYFHFASKEDLAWAVVADRKKRWLSLATEAVGDCASATEKLQALARAVVSLSLDESSSWNVVHLATELRAQATQCPIEDELLSVWMALVADVVREGQGTGELREDISPVDAAFLLVTTFDGLISVSDALAPGEREALHRRASLLAEFMLAGLSA